MLNVKKAKKKTKIHIFDLRINQMHQICSTLGFEGLSRPNTHGQKK